MKKLLLCSILICGCGGPPQAPIDPPIVAPKTVISETTDESFVSDTKIINPPNMKTVYREEEYTTVEPQFEIGFGRRSSGWRLRVVKKKHMVPYLVEDTEKKE